MIRKIRSFFGEVIGELKKVSWPTRNELLDATWLVIVSSAFLGVCIGIVDFFLAKGVAWFIRS